MLGTLALLACRALQANRMYKCMCASITSVHCQQELHKSIRGGEQEASELAKTLDAANKDTRSAIQSLEINRCKADERCAHVDSHRASCFHGDGGACEFGLWHACDREFFEQHLNEQHAVMKEYQDFLDARLLEDKTADDAIDSGSVAVDPGSKALVVI